MKRKRPDEDLDNPPLTDEELKRARRVTPEEHKFFHKAVERFRRRGRPKKTSDKYCPITIRIHPDVLEWAKAEADKRGLGYQTFINQTLLSQSLRRP